MSLIPENRHLLVNPIEEPISQNHDRVQLLMPDDFKPPQSLHVVCEVVAIAKDSKFYGEACRSDCNGTKNASRNQY